MQKHEGTQNTHHMGNCCKYEKDGTPNKAFAGKSVQRNPHNRNMQRKHNNYAQLSAKIAKLEKANKKLKHMNKKLKKDYNSNSNDSNSS